MVRPGLVDLIAVRADPGVSAATLARRITADLHGDTGYVIATGATRGQVRRAVLAAHGLLPAGAAVCAGTLIGLDRAVTGSAAPYIPPLPAALIITAVAALAFGTTMTSFRLMSRRPAESR